MLRSLWVIIVILILSTSCAPASLTTPTPSIQNATATPSPLPTDTNTSIPTATSTASITPLPTIPTFTPTFDARTIVTVTPAPKAECPKEDPSVVAKFATPNSDGPHGYIAPEVLDYLNSGGTAAQLRDSGLGEIIDLNGDGVNEVVYRGITRDAYIILGCNDGKYQDFLDFGGDDGVDLAGVVDLNKNGIPEIILYNFIHYGYIEISVFEWDGNKFRSLIDMGKYSSTDDTVIDWVSATSPQKIMDTNGDGLKEIVVVYDVNQLCGGFGDFCDGTPAREQTTILGWNGQNYVVKQRYYAPAKYRFQAIQDGDTASFGWELFRNDYQIALEDYHGLLVNSLLAYH